MTTPPKHACATCRALRACKHTFGAYYAEKSHDGAGCDAPMSAEHAEAVEAALDKAAADMAQADLFAQKAEDESRFAKREWIVVHMCREYPTMAKTPEGAINNIRWQLYGPRPMRTLPPFDAKPKTIGNMSRVAACERLARLTA